MALDDVTIQITLGVVSTVFSYVVTNATIPVVAKYLLNHTNLHGIDMGRRSNNKLPESLGIVAGLTYLASFLVFFIITPYVFMYLNILTSFSLSEKLCNNSINNQDGSNGYSNSLSNLAAITSIFAMLMLGFIDDCYDLRWRYKLIFPFLASLPLLSVYYYSYSERTVILVPQFIAKNLNIEHRLNLGVFYYLFMLMFVIFCTNSINIYAGINGLEVGQTIILTVTVIWYNLIEVLTKSNCDEWHILSLQLLIPFLFSSIALYRYNRYPAQVFVGDSYCYFAGITLAVVGILGHFSEEILLFASLQVFNFIISMPQLFRLVPCPRHRLPKYNEQTGLREPSTFRFKYHRLNVFGRLVINVSKQLGLAQVYKVDPSKTSTWCIDESTELSSDPARFDNSSKQSAFTTRSWIQETKSAGDNLSGLSKLTALRQSASLASSLDSHATRLADRGFRAMDDLSGGRSFDEASRMSAASYKTRDNSDDRYRLAADNRNDADDNEYECNNLTLINLWLCWFGPRSERDLCHQLLRVQCYASFLALAFLTFIKLQNEH